MWSTVRTVTEITLPRAKRPKRWKNGLRPGAVDNFISVTVLRLRKGNSTSGREGCYALISLWRSAMACAMTLMKLDK